MAEEEGTQKDRPTKIRLCRVGNADHSSTWEGFKTQTLKEALEQLAPILAKACSSTKGRRLEIGVFLEGQVEVAPTTIIEINVHPSKSRQRRQDAEKATRQKG